MDLKSRVAMEQRLPYIATHNRKREQSTVMLLTMDCSSEEMLEVYQEEPKEEPVSDIALPNSTSLALSIAGGGGVVIEQEAQCL